MVTEVTDHSILPTFISISQNLLSLTFFIFFKPQIITDFSTLYSIYEDKNMGKKKKKSPFTEHRFLWGCLSIRISCLKSQPLWISLYQRRESTALTLGGQWLAFPLPQLHLASYWFVFGGFLCDSGSAAQQLAEICLEGKRSKLD